MRKIGWLVYFSIIVIQKELTLFQGPERIKNLYAFRSIVDSGARITLGSDFPVESMNPLAGFYAAITRKSPTGDSPHGPDGWCVTTCLTIRRVLTFYFSKVPRSKAD